MNSALHLQPYTVLLLLPDLSCRFLNSEVQV